MVSRAIRSAQTQVEQQNFEIRKDILEYDEVMNQQRTVIYDERRRVLDGENLSEQIQNMIVDVVAGFVDGATSEGYSEDWDLAKLWEGLGQLFPVSVAWEDVVEEHDDVDRDLLVEVLTEDALEAYRRREEEIDGLVPTGGMRELERQVVLSVLDRKWREHLYEMDYLKQGIGLRAMAQRDPKIEYKREGFEMFSAMMEGIREESVGFLFNLTIQVEEIAPVDAVPGANPTTETATQPAIRPDDPDPRRLSTAGAAPVGAPVRPMGSGGPVPPQGQGGPRMVPPDARRPGFEPTAAIPAAPMPAAPPRAPADRPSQPGVPAADRNGGQRRGAPTGRRGRQGPPRGPQQPGQAPPQDAPTSAGPAMSQLGGGAAPNAFRGAGLGGRRPAQLNYSGPDEDGHAAAGGGPGAGAGRRAANPNQARRDDTPSRNAPCPCGSGRKYKQCHGAPAR
jgi:preprotein translocase subunit SecA